MFLHHHSTIFPTPSSGRRKLSFIIYYLLFIISATTIVSACSEDDGEYDPYYDWEERNAAWYEQIADSAQTAIAQARTAYGDEWESHCEWRMFKSLLKSQTHQSGNVADSICVHILSCGTGTVSPAYTDSVRVNYRGWLMPTTDANGTTFETIFTQTYYGTFDPATAAPNLAPPSTYNDGMATALQYMVEGDEWMVYIPQQLFYGAEEKGEVRAYSTVRMRLHMAAVYPAGTTVPKWKYPRK